MQTALITGGTGFIGRHLCRTLIEQDWQVEVLTRDPHAARQQLPEPVRLIDALDQAGRADVVINLAGENLAAGRWTEARKREMRESRLRMTRALVNTMAEWDEPPRVFVSGSAVGYYGACGERTVDEEESPADEFQSELCVAWEQAARRAEGLGVRVCRIRTGLVLGSDGGALAQMVTPFKLGLGGHFGRGDQYMPWIHIDDEVRAILFLVAHEECEGPFNLTAPAPVTNRQFTQTLAKVLHRPRLVWVPGPLLKLALGEMAHLLLTGQRAVPSALERAGFVFEYKTLRVALEDLLADTTHAA